MGGAFESSGNVTSKAAAVRENFTNEPTDFPLLIAVTLFSKCGYVKKSVVATETNEANVLAKLSKQSHGEFGSRGC